MRRLILQMQSSIDGFVGARGAFDWTVWDWGPHWAWDDALKAAFNATFERVDTILLSRPMAEEGYLTHWGNAARSHPADPAYAFAGRIVGLDKILASRTLDRSRWERTELVAGPLAAGVAAVKGRPGGDLICFGGAGFGRALLQAGLVDELQLYVNPTALGAGIPLIPGPLRMRLLDARPYACGIVVSRYAPLAAGA
ncbi:dihydrofolate reductase family protein [Labrys wisconsinensis]|uniref:Dihydrofolate reductase n=1 Tax=Labrys wisconsinensis TaxID=425677 RepID=A0ABU0JHL3_9HYPH|nr:dihydrofolate reductase family protein [Labrys wisconsinensis]MDQ0473782.1 dihydrofolate reductase [Labrys wisconsinensis]